MDLMFSLLIFIEQFSSEAELTDRFSNTSVWILESSVHGRVMTHSQLSFRRITGTTSNRDVIQQYPSSLTHLFEGQSVPRNSTTLPIRSSRL